MSTKSQLSWFAATALLTMAVALSASAAPISGDVLNEAVAGADRQLQAVHYRGWRHCHWRHGRRHCHGRYARAYRYNDYGYNPYRYGYYGFYPGISLGFGHHHHHHHGGHHGHH